MEQPQGVTALPAFDEMCRQAAGHLTEARDWLACHWGSPAPTTVQVEAKREAMALITRAKLKLAEARTPPPAVVAKPQADTDFTVSAVGLVVATVCTSLPNDDAAARLNAEHPTGISSRWEVADRAFPGGEPNGTPCDKHPETHRHLLFHC